MFTWGCYLGTLVLDKKYLEDQWGLPIRLNFSGMPDGIVNFDVYMRGAPMVHKKYLLDQRGLPVRVNFLEVP